MKRQAPTIILTLGLMAVASSVAVADWATEVANSNPMNWWRFEETAGTTADDQGFADLDGTYSSGVSLGNAGPVGGAAGFDGSSSVMVGGPDFTVEAIFKADTVNAGPSQGLIGADFTAANRMALKAEQWNSTERLGYTVFGVVDETFTDAPTPTDFAHVVFVGSSSGVELFVDGVPSGSEDTSTILSRHVIGAGAARADGSLIDGLVGMIDELVIYNRALDAGEIATHFQAVPEPGSLTLVLIGLLALVPRRRRS